MPSGPAPKGQPPRNLSGTQDHADEAALERPRQRGTVRRPVAAVRAGDPSGGPVTDAAVTPLDAERPVRPPPHRPGRRGPGQDARACSATRSLDDLVDAAVPSSVHSDTPLALAAGRARARGARRAARAGRPQPGAHLDDRARLPRHRHAAGDPAQRAGEPGLVHGVHALPAGDLAGPARGAAQLPDRRRRPDRAADRRRHPARRGDRRGRGDDARPAHQQGTGRRGRSSSTPTCCRRPSP